MPELLTPPILLSASASWARLQKPAAKRGKAGSKSFVWFSAVHRDRRDGNACLAKYGKDWERYTSIVKWRIVPLVY